MRIFVVVFLCFLISSFIAAIAFGDSFLTESQQEELARHPVWLKLLHFDTKRNTSEILSDDFFLSPQGHHDPQAELLATSRMILGNPFNNEIYGYMHLGEGRGLLFLRNPAEKTAAATLDIGRDVMLHAPGYSKCRLNGIFPEDNRLALTADRDNAVSIEMQVDSVMTFEVTLN